MPWIEVCRKCDRPFSITGPGAHNPGPRDREEINCAHCGAVWEIHKSAGVFRTEKLSAADEAAFKRGDLKSERY